MRFRLAFWLICLAAAAFVAFIALAHIVAPSGHRWTENTVSELAAQGQRHAWVMRAGFMGFGLLLATGLLVKARAAGGAIARDLPLTGYALAIALTGVFSTQPIDPGLPHSVSEARWHSVFATAAGVCLSVSMVGYAWTAPRWQTRLLHLAAFAVIVGLSLAFGLAESGRVGLQPGIVQRMLYASGLVWLVAGQWWDVPRIHQAV